MNRSQWKELLPADDAERQLIADSLAMAAEAAARGRIDAAREDMEWEKKGRRSYRAGSAVRHSVIDAALHECVICVRQVSGGRYGQKTERKKYFYLRRWGAGIRITDVSSRKLAHYCAHATQTGDVLRYLREGLESQPLPAVVCYKALVVTDAGLASCYDGSTWTRGVQRLEKPARDHDGGLYAWPSLALALEYARRIKESRPNDRICIAECTGEGKRLAYPNGKLAFARLTVNTILAVQVECPLPYELRA